MPQYLFRRIIAGIAHVVGIDREVRMPAQEFNLTMVEPVHPFGPVGNGSIQGHSVRMDNNHVVSKSGEKGLIALWNTTLTADAVGASKQYLTAIDQQVDKFGTTLGSADRKFVQELARAINNRSVVHKPGSTARPQGWDPFVQVFVWIPGNLFIGPMARVDAPKGDAFDTSARFIIAADQYSKLQNADTLIRKYLTDSRKPQYAEDAYADLAFVARTYLARAPFDANQWTWDSGRNLPKIKGA